MPSAATVWRRLYTDPEKLKPRIKLGLQLYAQGIMPTLKSASTAMGLHPNYLTIVASTTAGKRLMKSAHDIISQGITEKSALISALGHRAAEVTGTLMEDAQSEAVRLKAAQDLMDRDPELTKVQRHQVESFTLAGKDAKEIAAALAQSAQVTQRFAHLTTGNYDKVTPADPLPALPPPAEEIK